MVERKDTRKQQTRRTIKEGLARVTSRTPSSKETRESTANALVVFEKAERALFNPTETFAPTYDPKHAKEVRDKLAIMDMQTAIQPDNVDYPEMLSDESGRKLFYRAVKAEADLVTITLPTKGSLNPDAISPEELEAVQRDQEIMANVSRKLGDRYRLPDEDPDVAVVRWGKAIEEEVNRQFDLREKELGYDEEGDGDEEEIKAAAIPYLLEQLVLKGDNGPSDIFPKPVNN